MKSVDYRISWPSPNEHLYDIEISFRATRPETRLHLPAWRPGRYLIQNYAANVRQWSASGTRGRALPVGKTAKSTWQVTARRGELVRFRYRFFAGVLDAGSSFLDEGEAYFNGTNLFMMVEGQRALAARLTVDAPRNWKSVIQLPRQENGMFLARDWDHLIDSPAVFSPTLVRHSFRVEGCDFTLAFQNAGGWETKDLVAPVKAIIHAHARLFGGLPMRRYAFIYHLLDKWHGVEHQDSCSIILKRSELLGAGPGSKAWDHVLSITSHELFHVWNVKRILPAGFAPYDYSTETPTRLLWFMEGVTSYYGERMLRLAGLWSVDRYLQHLGEEIEKLETIPANRYLPLAQASFDAWLQDPAQMHDKDNAWFSFYNKGELVGAMLDLTLRRETRGRRSLDDLMRDLWKRYGSRGRGLEEDAIETSAVRLAGEGLRAFFENYVSGVEPLPYEELLRSAGVTFHLAPKSPEGKSFGIRVAKSEGRLVVRSVRNGSAGMGAGILPGDEIIAVAGTRVAEESVLDAATGALPLDSVARVLTARADVLVEREVRVERETALAVKLARAEDAAPAEQKTLRAWLGED